MILLGWLLSALLAGASLVAHPIGASCAALGPRWALDGVRPDGWTECVLVPAETACSSAGGCDDGERIEARVALRVRCRHDERPRCDGLRVWCARRAGS